MPFSTTEYELRAELKNRFEGAIQVAVVKRLGRLRPGVRLGETVVLVSFDLGQVFARACGNSALLTIDFQNLLDAYFTRHKLGAIEAFDFSFYRFVDNVAEAVVGKLWP